MQKLHFKNPFSQSKLSKLIKQQAMRQKCHTKNSRMNTTAQHTHETLKRPALNHAATSPAAKAAMPAIGL